MGGAYWQGFRAGAPFVLVVAPSGLLFGVVATEAGLDLLQTRQPEVGRENSDQLLR